MAINLKTTGLDEFQKAIFEYEAASKKTRAEVLEHRARNLAFALHREAQKVGRAAKAKIKQVESSRMRVFPVRARTRAQEKARRIFAAGYVASGWIPSLKKFRESGSVNVLANVSSPQGSVVINHRAGFIDLINSTPGAAEAEAKHAISDKALRGQAEDMRKYLDRKDRENLGRFWR